MLDSEAVIARDDGRRTSARCEASAGAMRRCCTPYLIEHDGADLRDLPLIERKRRLVRLLGRAKRRSIGYNDHFTGDGPTVFEHVCRMGLEGIVSKRTDGALEQVQHLVADLAALWWPRHQ